MGALDAGLLAVGDIEDGGVEAAALGPAQVHAKKHLRPVLGLGAAGAGMDGEQGVAGVVGAAEGEVELKPVEAGGDRGGLAGYLVLNGAVVLALGEVEQLFKLGDVAFEAAPL